MAGGKIPKLDRVEWIYIPDTNTAVQALLAGEVDAVEQPPYDLLPQMKKGEDGSLTLYLQKDSPGADKESNWLPAPDGPIYLVMRLYWPKTEAPSILPIGKGDWKPPGVVKAQLQ